MKEWKVKSYGAATDSVANDAPFIRQEMGRTVMVTDKEIRSLNTVVSKSCRNACVENAVGIYKKRLLQHTPGISCGVENPDCILRIAVDSSLAENVFTIEDREPNIIEISAHDVSVLFAALGEFLHCSEYDNAFFRPFSRRGKFTLKKNFRGVYFATHFYNYYHSAPVDELKEYIEDMALWGFNVLTFWYDMHHFKSFHDPDAVDFRTRLAAITDIARKNGMKIVYGFVANEASDDSPVSLRAVEDGAKRGGWYDSQICPSSPGGMEYIKSSFEMVSKEFISRIMPDYFQFWPYDQGGCGCVKCRPWGGNGFLRIYEEIAPFIADTFPDAKLIVSSWFFDDEEWKILLERLKNNKQYCDYVMEEIPSFKSRPDFVPVIGFPEISMDGSWPWGGFGATPRPAFFQSQWDARKNSIDGGSLYSEGIYEDVNKVIFSQFYCWDCPADESVRKYVSYEFGSKYVDDIADVVRILEENHHMRYWPGLFKDVAPELLTWFPSRNAEIQDDPDAEKAYAAVCRIDSELPDPIRKSWRWRILYLRALLDARLKLNHGSPDDVCENAFSELTTIFHAENAEITVSPPLSSRKKFGISGKL